jgi:hypothetical protein
VFGSYFGYVQIVAHLNRIPVLVCTGSMYRTYKQGTYSISIREAGSSDTPLMVTVMSTVRRRVCVSGGCSGRMGFAQASATRTTVTTDNSSD